MRFVLAPAAAAAAFFGVAATAEARVQINVDLTSQTMHVASAGGEEYDWAVSTGRPGHRTPTGVYRPQRMFVMTHSIKYENAPMPHAIFFTGGYAIHGTESVGMLGRVASHGCVRLAPENAAALFELVKHEGASIVIHGQAPGRELVAEHHRAGHRLAAAMRRRWREQGLAYAPAPRHHARSLRAWARDPFGSD
jgi:lipoprotein-anchoring transpeptidase ErfK/SrfK